MLRLSFEKFKNLFKAPNGTDRCVVVSYSLYYTAGMGKSRGGGLWIRAYQAFCGGSCFSYEVTFYRGPSKESARSRMHDLATLNARTSPAEHTNRRDPTRSAAIYRKNRPTLLLKNFENQILNKRIFWCKEFLGALFQTAIATVLVICETVRM